MDSFEPGHARMSAIEWLLQKFVTEQCLAASNPAQEVRRLKQAAEDYHSDMLAVLPKLGEDGLSRIVELTVAIDLLIEPIVQDVTEATKS